MVDSLRPYSSTLKQEVGEIDTRSGNYKINLIGYAPYKLRELYAVVSIRDKEEILYYESFFVGTVPKIWSRWGFQGTIPKSLPASSKLTYYLWSKTNSPFWYKELQLEFIE